eukprot:4915-Heterococcus_DN1.PRE.2
MVYIYLIAAVVVAGSLPASAFAPGAAALVSRKCDHRSYRRSFAVMSQPPPTFTVIGEDEHEQEHEAPRAAETLGAYLPEDDEQETPLTSVAPVQPSDGFSTLSEQSPAAVSADAIAGDDSGRVLIPLSELTAGQVRDELTGTHCKKLTLIPCGGGTALCRENLAKV